MPGREARGRTEERRGPRRPLPSSGSLPHTDMEVGRGRSWVRSIAEDGLPWLMWGAGGTRGSLWSWTTQLTAFSHQGPLPCGCPAGNSRAAFNHSPAQGRFAQTYRKHHLRPPSTRQKSALNRNPEPCILAGAITMHEGDGHTVQQRKAKGLQKGQSAA